MEIQGLHFEGEIIWNKVFQKWVDSEGVQDDLQQIAREKGWRSLEEWRDTWVRNFGAQDRKWFQYTILEPNKTIPLFRIGPARSWQNNFPPKERNKHTFATFVERGFHEQDKKILNILEDFPATAEFIGIYMPDKSIVAIEGHHRATALALAVKNRRVVTFAKLPTIALTSFIEGEEILLDITLEKGSAKEIPNN